MLKYIKYDLKATYKVLIGFLLAGILFSTYVQFNITSANTAVKAGVAIGILLGFCLIISFVTFSIRMFSKEINTDQAYLTFLVPKHAWQMVASKLIVVYVWSFIYIYVGIMYNIYLNILIGNGIMENGHFNHIDFIKGTLVITLAIITILSIIYLSLSLTKLAFKNPKLKLIWIVILILLLYLYSLGINAMNYFNYGDSYNLLFTYVTGFRFVFHDNLYMTIYNILVTLGAIFSTGYILDKKLNI